MKAKLSGTITEETYLEDINKECKVVIEPSPLYFKSELFTDREGFEKLIIINGVEPKDINDISNELIIYQHYFDAIYSYDERVLRFCPNSNLFCFGSCWILKDRNGNRIETFSQYHDSYNIDDKIFKLSFLKSQKNQLPGHKLRHLIDDKINFFQGEVLYPPNKIDSKCILFDDSMFHIAIENSKYENYFTEKIIDCFMSRTIPIYCGCPNIGEYFHTDGMFIFENVEELGYIIKNLSTDKYHERIFYIEENYKRAKKFAFFFDNLNNIIQYECRK